VTETEWAPPLPDAWSLDDVFAGCAPPATPTRELVTSPDRDLVVDLWSADARMAREAANLYVAVESLARRRPADADRRAGTPGAPGVDSRALAAPRLGGVSEAFVPELAMIRSCTETEATTLALEAVALVRHLPETLQALREGRCDQRTARALVELLPDGRLRVRTPSGVVRTTWPPGQLAAPEPPAAAAAPERPDQPAF